MCLNNLITIIINTCITFYEKYKACIVFASIIIINVFILLYTRQRKNSRKEKIYQMFIRRHRSITEDPYLFPGRRSLNI